MTRLQGRTVVLTGAGGGIGTATAVRLAERGASLALIDVNEAALRETASLVKRAGARVSVHVADVGNREAVADLPAQVVAAHGACHVLINSAGVNLATDFESGDVADERWLLDINLWGVMYGCRYFLPELRRHHAGHIVNVSSMAALAGLPGSAVYCASKAAVRAFTEALRQELAGSGVQVTVVLPGTFRTGIMVTARGGNAERMSKLARSGLGKLMLRPPDAVARKILQAIEQDRRRVVVGVDARLLDVTSRLLPGRSGPIGWMTNLTR